MWNRQPTPSRDARCQSTIPYPAAISCPDARFLPQRNWSRRGLRRCVQKNSAASSRQRTRGRTQMVTAIVRSSLRHRGVVVAIACMLIGYGCCFLKQAKYDLFPQSCPPQVVVTAEAPGLAPEQVELLVTQPIETAVNGVSGVQSIRSASIQGLSVITVLFNANTNVYLDRQLMTERLSTLAGALPSGISPTVAPLTTSTSVVMAIGLTSPTQSPMQLRTVADWTVKLRLLAVPGGSKIAVFGGAEKQCQVQTYPPPLTRHDIGFVQALFRAH